MDRDDYDLKRESEIERENLRHPDCRDPMHLGCECCDLSEDEISAINKPVAQESEYFLEDPRHTIRRQIATRAMVAIIRKVPLNSVMTDPEITLYESVAGGAVEYADALLGKLDSMRPPWESK